MLAAYVAKKVWPCNLVVAFGVFLRPISLQCSSARWRPLCLDLDDSCIVKSECILVPQWTFVATPFKLALGVELASSVTTLHGKSRFPGRMGNAHPGDWWLQGTLSKTCHFWWRRAMVFLLAPLGLIASDWPINFWLLCRKTWWWVVLDHES